MAISVTLNPSAPTDTQTQDSLTAAQDDVIENPTAPIITDKVAKPLWLVLALVTVSAPPILSMTVIDWTHWSPTVASQVSATIVAWAGSVATVLGLSRYAKTAELGK